MADKKLCEFPLCTYPEDRDGFCVHHAKHFAGPKPEKKQTPIPKISKKRKADQKEYVKIVKEMLSIDPNCEIKESGCQVKASGLHHKKKRTPATFLDKRFLKRSCDNCNLWCELHPIEAIHKGHSISKHKPHD
jgi:hypothetical protein